MSKFLQNNAKNVSSDQTSFEVYYKSHSYIFFLKKTNQSLKFDLIGELIEKLVELIIICY